MRCSGYGCHLTFRLRSWRIKNSDYPTDVPFLFFNHLMFWDYPIASPRAPFKPEAASSQQCEKRHEVHAFLRPNFEISPLFPRCRRLKTWGWVRIDPTSPHFRSRRCGSPPPRVAKRCRLRLSSCYGEVPMGSEGKDPIRCEVWLTD